MVKAPTRLAPTRNYKLARQRGRLVIAAMIEQGMLTPAQRKALRPARVRVEPQREVPTGTYFADWVLPAARNRPDDEEGYGAQEVQTTLEARLQTLAVRTVRRAGLGKAQVGLVAMRPDGRVVAMVGGKDYAKSPFNRATQARRQPGSTFKLFVYLAALRAGMSPDSTVEDRPLKIGDWQPKNSHNQYRGQLSLRQAFALSSNVAAVRLQEQVGRRNVIKAARDLGVTSPLSDDPSLALGTAGVTLLEMTRAYAAIAAGAYPVKAQGLMEKPKPWWQRMWSSYVSQTHDGSFDEMKELLAGVVASGTGQGARLQVPTYGKTGTSQDNRDAIFIGFTDNLVVGVWVGNDDNSPLGQVAGGGLPARIWRDFTAAAIGTSPVRLAAPPPVEAPVEATGNVSFSVPLGDTGVEVGVDINGDNVDFSTRDTRNQPDDQGPPPPPPADDEAVPPPDDDEPPPPPGGI
jgi:penicillin-binding protein 1A